MSGSPRLPRDPALPALHDLFPDSGAPEFVVEAAREMAGLQLDASRVKIKFVRYRPTKSCVVLWTFRSDAGRAVMVSGRLFHNDRGAGIVARPSFERQAAEAGKGIGGRAPYRYLPDRQLLLQLFPLDLRLPALTSIASEAWVQAKFSPLLGASVGEIRVLSAKPVSYKPWRRCVYRYALDVAGRTRRYFGKLFLDDRGAQQLGWLRAIEERLRTSDAPWRIVAPAGYVGEAHLLLLEAVEDAVEVKDMLKEASKEGGATPALLDVMVRAAEGIRAFQNVELNGLPEAPPLEVVRDLEAGTEGIDVVAPEFAAPASRMLRALTEQARELRPEPLTPTHGAFRHDQFLLAGSEMVAMDLDTLCRSGASADAGNFLGYLDVTAVRRPELKPAIEQCAAAFQEAALRLPNCSAEWTSWYRAAAHVKKALRSFYSLDPKWPGTAETLLSQAERALSSGAVV